jgi:putative flippase GtrA
MSAGEFALSIVLGMIVTFIVHEYIVWRRKRIAAVVKA